MRTNRLRHWLLRGALLSAAAVAPLTAATPAQADFNWQEIPPTVSTTGVDAEGDAVSDLETSLRNEDFNWQ
jgi:hypothetical protein